MAFVIMIGLIGCGQGDAQEGDRTNAGGSPQDQQGDEQKEQNGVVAGEIVPLIEDKGNGKLVYSVKNQTEKPVTLEFTSSQRIDYKLTTKGENPKDVFLFSSVASFMQAIGTETMKQGEELKYDIDLSKVDVEPGEYVLEVWMTTKNGEMYKVKTDYTIK
jgi:hypothetical protein